MQSGGKPTRGARIERGKRSDIPNNSRPQTDACEVAGVRQAFQPAIVSILKQAGWKACLTRKAPT